MEELTKKIEYPKTTIAKKIKVFLKTLLLIWKSLQ